MLPDDFEDVDPKVSYCVGESWSHTKLPVCASESISSSFHSPNHPFIHVSPSINPTEIGKSVYPHKHPLKKSQGTPATRPQCLTSPTARRSACSVELSTGNSPDWVLSPIVSLNSASIEDHLPLDDDNALTRYRCNEGVPMSGSESLYCDGNVWNGSVRNNLLNQF